MFSTRSGLGSDGYTIFMYLKDPKTKEPSVTLTAFVLGFGIATFKLLLSGITLSGVKLDAFTGVDFAAAMGALGAIYAMRRSKDDKTE